MRTLGGVAGSDGFPGPASGPTEDGTMAVKSFRLGLLTVEDDVGSNGSAATGPVDDGTVAVKLLRLDLRTVDDVAGGGGTAATGPVEDGTAATNSVSLLGLRPSGPGVVDGLGAAFLFDGTALTNSLRLGRRPPEFDSVAPFVSIQCGDAAFSSLELSSG